MLSKSILLVVLPLIAFQAFVGFKVFRAGKAIVEHQQAQIEQIEASVK